jgi:hypothetical protein
MAFADRESCEVWCRGIAPLSQNSGTTSASPFRVRSHVVHRQITCRAARRSVRLHRAATSGGLRAPPRNSPGMERRQRAHERDRLKFVVHGAMRSRSRLGIGRAHRHNDHAASLCRSVHEVVTPYRLAKRNPQTIPRGGRTASPTSTAPVPKWAATPTPLQSCAPYFGGCSPGLDAHLPAFSRTSSWLGLTGGFESRGIFGNSIFLSMIGSPFWHRLKPPKMKPQ